MASLPERTLHLKFHGRIIDHLGIQMYQSPVAAIAEMIANAWDADAEKVKITLPAELTDDAEIIISDDGIGMTYEQCDARYLNVGFSRRGETPDERSPEKKRAILGRKGIGKLAGFGIAQVIHVDTISKVNGERTVFELNLEEIRGEEYLHREGIDIKVLRYESPF